MIAIRSWIRRRARALLDRSAVEADMNAELALHFDLRVRELEASGRSPYDARRQAVAEFGGMEHVRESYRDARGVVTVETIMQDISYALRTLWRQRTFTVTAVLTFAAGIGATTAIYSLVDTAWFGWARMFPDADHVAMVYKTFPQGRGAVSPADYRDWRDQSRSFSDLAAYTRTLTTLTAGGEPARFRTVAATPNYFAVVGVHPLLGRFFQDGETQWGNNNVVVLSHGTWQKSFAGDPAVLGRRITLDGKTAQIIGVAPPGAWFARGAPEVYVPLSFAPNDPTNDRHSHFLFSLGRLAPGRTMAQANAELRVIADRIAAVNPENQGTRAVAVPVSEVVLGDVKPMMKLLLAAAALLLIIAAANVTNLQLARTTSRVRELAVRAALGASAPRIMRQLLTESLVVAILGGLCGVGIAMLVVALLGGDLPIDLPRVADVGVSIEWRALLVSFVIVLGAGIVCGILPALDLLHGNRGQAATSALRQGNRAGAGSRRTAFVRSALVSAQVALATMLMVASGLLGRSLLTMQRANTGVDPKDVVSVRLNPSPTRIESAQSAIQFYDAVLAKAAAIPGVDLAGVASHLPLSGGGETKNFWIDGHAPSRLEDVPSVVGRMESPNTLKALGVPLLRGRWFTEQDGPEAPYVAIIGESVARRYFANSDPLGQRISLHAPETLSPPTGDRAGLLWPRFTVIGVVKDVQYGDARDAKEDAVYVDYAQGRQVWTWGPQWLVVKTHRPAGLVAGELRDALQAVDASMPVTDVRPLSDQMALSLKAPRFTAGLIATFAIVAALLGIVGLYGVISYTIAQETPAFGVRLALGAQPGDISAMVLRRGLVLAGVGVIVGIAGATASTRFISAQLFGVQALDLPSYAIATSVLILLSLLATLRPARRAASTDVLVALRAE